MILNTDQQKCADKILAGESVAIIAESGSGKSFLLKDVVDILESRGMNVAICCPTGAAAVNIGMGATTIHRLFGFKPEIQTPIKRGNKIKDEKARVLAAIDVLVIDEIGNTRLDLLEAMDYSLRKVNNTDKPWGGKICVCTGDFSQAKPVLSGKERPYYERYFKSVWAFDSESFNTLNLTTLSKIERNTDPIQQKVLRSVRFKDKYAAKAIEWLNKNAEPYTPDMDKIVLCQFNADADEINAAKYKENTNQEHTYVSVQRGTDKDLKDVRAPHILKIKQGLRVMIIANDIEDQYVNGDQGEVVSCEKECVVVKLDRTGENVLVAPFEWDIIKYGVRGEGLTKSIIASRKQLPLMLGYAVSVHKAQGSTLDSAAIHMGNKSSWNTMESIFYVAISRVRDLKKLSFVRPARLDDIKVDQKANDFTKRLEELCQ